MDKDLILGFDCGGTKTKVDIAVMGEELSLEDSFTVGGMNINAIGREGVLEAMAEAFDAVGPERLSRVRGICYGAAGISNPLTREVFLEGTRRAFMPPFPVPLLIGDHQAALWGAHAGGDGIILIAGTGSVCCGRRRNYQGHWQEARCGGYGHLIDDEGSGYALGRDVLSAVVRSIDGRIPPTVMRQAVFEQLGISTVQQLIGFVYDKETTKKDIAALASILELGLAAGEKAANDILEKGARELAELVVPVARELGLQSGRLTFCGGVLTKNERMAAAVNARLKDILPDLKVSPAIYDAAFGACLAAAAEII